MSMKYKTKCICQIDPEYKTKHAFINGICIWCHNTGEVEYDLHIDEADGKWNFESVKIWAKNPDEEIDAGIVYDDITMKIKCSCGDEVFLTQEGDVCSCGRIYYLDVRLKKNDSHKGDMEYWEKVKKEKYNR